MLWLIAANNTSRKKWSSYYSISRRRWWILKPFWHWVTTGCKGKVFHKHHAAASPHFFFFKKTPSSISFSKLSSRALGGRQQQLVSINFFTPNPVDEIQNANTKTRPQKSPQRSRHQGGRQRENECEWIFKGTRYFSAHWTWYLLSWMALMWGSAPHYHDTPSTDVKREFPIALIVSPKEFYTKAAWGHFWAKISKMCSDLMASLHPHHNLISGIWAWIPSYNFFLDEKRNQFLVAESSSKSEKLPSRIF